MAFAPSWVGKQIGDFIVEEAIGRGGMGVVYAARQRSVARRVALKVIDLQPGEEGDFLQRFTREAEVIAMLEHIHILPIYNYGVLDGEVAYFAMRLLPHGTLAEQLRQGALPLDDAVDLFSQIASGLQYIHSKGVIHRDLKPSNILLDENGNAYLSDFGLARLNDASVNLSDEMRHMVGSPAYLAPEVIEGQVADHLSDIYSLAVVLYEMLCGRLPFESDEGGITALLYKHVHEKPPALRQFNPTIPPAVEAIVLRSLSKNPHGRYASAEEMADDLRAAAQHPAPRATWMLHDALHNLPKPRRPVYAALLICASVLLVVLAVLASRQNRGAPPMNVLPGEHAALADLTLSDDEIALARSRLGDNGFIANFPCTLTDAYQTAVARELSELAIQDNLPLRTYDNQDDPARQLTLIEQARLDGAKAFILCPLGEPLLDDTIHSLQQATIPLVLALHYDSTYGIKVELDNEAVGQEQGRYAGQILEAEHGGRGTVVVLSFMDVGAGELRAQGMEDGLHAVAPRVDVIGPLNGYTREQAKAAIQALLDNGTRFDAILTMTDAGALGAIDALKAAHLTPQDVFIVSANGEEPISSYISEGYYVRGSVALDRGEDAQLLLTGIVKALAGSPVAEYLSLSSGHLLASPPPPTDGGS